jgi:cytochrome c553
MNTPVLGVSQEDPGKFILGTVPVEADGSAYFKVPSGVPVFFQALDGDGIALQTMRTLTYALPGQTLSCIGCHESRDMAPPMGKPALALQREPSPITPGAEGTWPLRFDRLVQPVLNRHCLPCHEPGGKGAVAAKIDLTGNSSYEALMSFAGEDLKKQAFERDRSVVNEGVTANAKLWKMLAGPETHQGVRLDHGELQRLATWMDTYAHRVGHFSEQQEQELTALKAHLTSVLAK